MPHTLEHLIFTGSKLFPERGYLDKLATVCLSNGTNAYTTDDHTCYTVTTASLDGLVELLPVYLDHILRPCLKPSDMALEVFSLSPEDEARGVVYCEMKSREYSEADQMDLRLRSLSFEKALGEDAELNTYRWECGGATQRISHLSPGEILAYHQKWYQPGKLTIFVSGVLPGDKRDLIKNVINGYLNEFTPCQWENAPLESIEKPIAEDALDPEALFPADDESIGSVGFSWLGPAHHDLKSILALHVLLRAWKETTASPLFQEFVECVDPAATDIDYDVKFLKRTLITLIFSGVPNHHGDDDEDCEEGSESDAEHDDEAMDTSSASSSGSKLVPGLIRERMFDVFDRLLADDAAFLKFIQTALASFTIRLQEQVEEDPHELAFGYCIPEILNESVEALGTALCGIPSILQSLKEEPLDYWKTLHNQYLTRDGCTEVIMRPSSAFPEEIKAREVANLQEVKRLDAFPKTGTALLESFGADSIPRIPLPNAFGEPVDRLVLGDACPAIQLVTLPNRSSASASASSGFCTVTVGICVRDAVDAELWPYLVLFQELIFQSTLSIPPGSASGLLEAGKRYSYQEVQQLLSLLFTSFEAAVGLGNEMFSASYLDSHLILSATFPRANARGVTVQSALRLLLQALAHTLFEPDRIRVTAENLASQLAEAKRDPATILDAIFTQQARKCIGSGSADHDEHINANAKRGRVESGWMSEAINVFTQETFLAELQAKLETRPEAIVERLNAIVSGLLGHSAGSFVHVGGAEGVTPADIHAIWGGFFAGMALGVSTTPSFRASEELPRIGGRVKHITDAIRLVPMADVTAAYLACSVPVSVLATSSGSFGPHDPAALHSMLSLVLACSILSFTEGPLYNRIRGKGLAYGAHLSLSLWNGLLSLDINDSTAPFEAFCTFLELIRDVEAECDAILNGTLDKCQMICHTTLEAARAAFVYRLVSERASPANTYAIALRSALRGGYPLIDGDGDAVMSRLINGISLVDIARALKPHLPAFHEPGKRILTCVLPPSGLPQLRRDFGVDTD